MYAISFTASDGKDGTCSGVVHVCVPHDQGDPTCVDDGQKYNSLGTCTAGNTLAPESVSLSVTQIIGSQAEVGSGLPADASVNVSVYDVIGRRMATLESGMLSAGAYTLVWNMEGVARGLNFVRLRAGSTTLVKRVLKLH